MTDKRPVEKTPSNPLDFLEHRLVINAPWQIAEATKEGIVRWWPRITLCGLVLVLPALHLFLPLMEFGVSFGGAADSARFGYAQVCLAIQLALMLISVPGMFARKPWAWLAAFYALLFGLLVGLLGATIADRPIAQTFVASLLLLHFGLLYLLFQVRARFRPTRSGSASSSGGHPTTRP
jgi:hypothetical protein